MVEVKVMKGRKAINRITTYSFRRADLGTLRDLQGKLPWDVVLEGKGDEDNCLSFKVHLIQAHSHVQKAWGPRQHEKGRTEEVEAGLSHPGRLQETL